MLRRTLSRIFLLHLAQVLWKNKTPRRCNNGRKVSEKSIWENTIFYSIICIYFTSWRDLEDFSDEGEPTYIINIARHHEEQRFLRLNSCFVSLLKDDPWLSRDSRSLIVAGSGCDWLHVLSALENMVLQAAGRFPTKSCCIPAACCLCSERALWKPRGQATAPSLGFGLRTLWHTSTLSFPLLFNLLTSVHVLLLLVPLTFMSLPFPETSVYTDFTVRSKQTWCCWLS